jgi:hypothetical protein
MMPRRNHGAIGSSPFLNSSVSISKIPVKLSGTKTAFIFVNIALR